ncbi:redoxin domain-containing protein [Flavobacterium sp. LMO8]|uniref:peroxiredoxin-like family protein n=1 Tax=Flavobacterium sp. LMO8 TaxID=2654244 RepID=UPI0012926003|nr:peroxiredoxin-like family protein [Flavobacterium sp. LMO8]MQP25246.1 redoxin domain-containing protein [Flavobacterium sp. LMO8]
MKKIVTLLLLSLTMNSFAQIADAPENISPLLIGEKIPNIILHDSDGVEVNTSKILSKKTVLVVYRGGWCPYCNSQLADMQEIENQIIALGYQIVAVSPDAPSFLKQTEDKKELKYQLYSDSEGKLAQSLGIAFKREKPKLDKYSEGKNPGFLPVPTVYVLNKNNEIEFLYINPNYSKRLDGKLLLAVLKSL